MRQDSTKRLVEYWNRLRGNRAAPQRSEVEPSDIREVLGDTFILEISAPLRTISYRLAGTRLCAAYGRELKGVGYLGLWSEEDNFDIAKAVARVYRDLQPMLLSYKAETASGRFVEYESVLLPLAPAADGNSRILGIATVAKPPFWLGAEALECNHLASVRLIETKTPALAPFGHEDDGSVDVAPRRVAHLTVFDGGRE